jgi:hypothetical protein
LKLLPSCIALQSSKLLKNLAFVHFLAKDFYVVRIVCLNVSIGNCVPHDLVSSVVEDLKCVRLVVALHEQPKI